MNFKEMKFERKKIISLVFFLEELLILISTSRFKDSFIIGGNLVLNQVFKRNSDEYDLELGVFNVVLNKFNINRIFKEILKQNEMFTIKSIEKTYYGYTIAFSAVYGEVVMLCKVNILEISNIIQGGKYNYKSIMHDNSMTIKTYKLEEIMAIKFVNIILKRNYSIKDFYDIYLLYTKYNLDNKIIKLLIKEIFLFYKKEDKLFNIDDILYVLKNNNGLQNKWIHYIKIKMIEIEYENVINIFYELRGLLE